MTFDFKQALKRSLGSNYDTSVYEKEQQGIAKYGNKHMFRILRDARDCDANRTKYLDDEGREIPVRRVVLVGKEEEDKKEQLRKDSAERLIQRLIQLKIIDDQYPLLEKIRVLDQMSLDFGHMYLGKKFPRPVV